MFPDMFRYFSLNNCTFEFMHYKPNYQSPQLHESPTCCTDDQQEASELHLPAGLCNTPYKYENNHLLLCHFIYITAFLRGRADRPFLQNVQLLLIDSPFIASLKGYKYFTAICLISVQGERQHGSLLLSAAHVK